MFDIPKNKLSEVISNYDALSERISQIIKAYKSDSIESNEIDWLQIKDDEIAVDYHYYDSSEYFSSDAKFPIDWLYLDDAELRMKIDERREADRLESLRKAEERKQRAAQEAEARELAELARLKAKYEGGQS